MASERLTIPFNAAVGLRVSVARTGRRVTQERAAKYLGVSRPQMANLEAGRSNWNAEHLWRLSRLLRVRITQLLPPVSEAPDA